MDNHISASFEIPTKDDELDLPSLYWMFNLQLRMKTSCVEGEKVKCF
jgi:hypothetical protein